MTDVQKLGKLIAAHLPGVRQLFFNYGYKKIANPTAKDVANAIVVHGEPFQREFENIVFKTNSFGSEVSDWLGKIVGTLTGAKVIADAVTTPPIVPGQQPTTPTAPKPPATDEEPEPILGLHPTLFYALLIGIVIIAIMFLMKYM